MSRAFHSFSLAIILLVIACTDRESPTGPVHNSASSAGVAVASAVSPPLPEVIFSSNRDGNYNIYAMSPDGTGVVQITDAPSAEGTPVWSPDGLRIAFVSNCSSPRSPSDIFVLDLMTTALPVTDVCGQLPNLTNNPGSDSRPSWSPDGTEIAFHSDRGGGHIDVYVMAADGSNPVNVTNNAGSGDGSPAWLPDPERRILAFTSRRTGASDVFTLDVNTGDIARLTSGAWGDNIAWFRDGDGLAYVTFGRIYRLPVPNPALGLGQEVRVWTSDGRDVCREVGKCAHPAWSPDGEQLVVEVHPGFWGPGPGPGGADIYVANRDGTGLRRLTNDPHVNGAPDWRWGPSDPIIDQPVMELEYDTRLFPDLSRDETHTLNFWVYNTGNAELTGEAKLDPDFDVLELHSPGEFTIQAGDRRLFRVTFSPTGRFEGELFSGLLFDTNAGLDGVVLIAESSPCVRLPGRIRGTVTPGGRAQNRRCHLITKLRDEYTGGEENGEVWPYFNMSREDVTNTRLYDYLMDPDHLKAFETMVAYVDYGRGLADFFHRDPRFRRLSPSDAEEHYMDLLEGSGHVLIDALGLVGVLGTEGVTRLAIAHLTHAVTTVYLGYEVYNLATTVIWARELDFGLRWYFQIRRADPLDKDPSDAARDAWEDLRQIGDEEGLLNKALVQATGVPDECMPEWLEQAYQAYIYDDQAIWTPAGHVPPVYRADQGRALAKVARDGRSLEDRGLEMGQCP